VATKSAPPTRQRRAPNLADARFGEVEHLADLAQQQAVEVLHREHSPLDLREFKQAAAERADKVIAHDV
jgi:hypothetical protein